MYPALSRYSIFIFQNLSCFCNEIIIRIVFFICLLKRLEDARKHAEQGACIDADAFVADMRTKYGI
jgi:hypothetical protein